MPSDDRLSHGTHMIMVHGVEQRYHVSGQGAVCVAHSGGPGINWEYLQMPLVERHFTMVYVEPIGTGLSGRLAGHPDGYSVERYAQQLLGLLDALDLRRVFLIGHSHGGFVVQQLAIASPERVAGLLLYDTSAITGGDFMGTAGEAVRQFCQRRAGDPEAQDALQAWNSFGSMSSDSDYIDVIRRLLPVYFADPDRMRVVIEQFRSSLEAVLVHGDGQPFDVCGDLPGMSVPTLILVGEHDFICGPRWAGILHSLIPDSQLVIFNESGHFAHIEQPEQFAKALAGFATRIDLH